MMFRFDRSVISYRVKLGKKGEKKKENTRNTPLCRVSGDWNITCKHSTKSCNRLDQIKGGNYDQSKRSFSPRPIGNSSLTSSPSPSFVQLSFDPFDSFFLFESRSSFLVNEVGEIIESNSSSHPRISGAWKLKSIERLYDAWSSIRCVW